MNPNLAAQRAARERRQEERALDRLRAQAERKTESLRRRSLARLVNARNLLVAIHQELQLHHEHHGGHALNYHTELMLASACDSATIALEEFRRDFPALAQPRKPS